MRVFAVPRSMARSREKRVCNQSNIEAVVGFRGNFWRPERCTLVEHVSVARTDRSTQRPVPGTGL